jgi:hypothetical protein
MEVKGTIILIKDTETVGAKGFKKRLIVIKTDSQYPQSIPVEFVQDKCQLLNNFSVGQFVTIAINILGSEWKGNYYVNLQGWKISMDQAELSSSSFMPGRGLQGDMANQFNDSFNEEEHDDLPF